MNHTADQFNNDCRNLKAVLEKQHIQLVKMLSILHREHQALVANNLPDFEDAVQQKHQQVKNLEEIQHLLTAVEKTIGGALSKSTFSAFIQRIPSGDKKSQLKEIWDKFQATLEHCDQQNKINNRILNASSINIKQALNILRGNVAVDTPVVYGASGQQQDHMQGQSIAIA